MKTFFELNKKFNKIKNNGWILSQGNGNGAGGITFEKLLNIQTNNFEIPDFKDIELKVKYSNKEKYISLFNATPDSFLYEIKRINDEYGYSDKDFPNYNIFQTSVYSKLKINEFYRTHSEQRCTDTLVFGVFKCEKPQSTASKPLQSATWPLNELFERVYV